KITHFTMLAPFLGVEEEELTPFLKSLSPDAKGFIGLPISYNHKNIINEFTHGTIGEDPLLETLSKYFDIETVSYEEAQEKGLCPKGQLIAGAFGTVMFLTRKKGVNI
ncbi:MAG: hypothetical protein AAF621_01800, partial [Pseudomonadota bacterium]